MENQPQETRREEKSQVTLASKSSSAGSEMNGKTLISRSLQLAMIYGLLLACLNFHTAQGCGPGRAGGRRRLMRRYPPLVVRQYIPNVSENTLGASGRHEGPIRRRDKRFKELVMNQNPDIEFTDQERTGADRMMSQRLKEKLSTLAISVMNHWPNVKLRVIEGWDEDNMHTINSLHYEGRAVDITTSDKDRSKYGMLARLAVEAGFDWVHYESRSHVHCSVKSEKADTIRNNGCFDAGALVMTPEGEMEMSELQINDLVLSMNQQTGKLVYSPVIMWLDRDAEGQELFVELRTKSNQLIRLTSSHLIYVADEMPTNDLLNPSDSTNPIREQLQIGNSNGNNTSKDNYYLYRIGESDDHSKDINAPLANNNRPIIEPPLGKLATIDEFTFSKANLDELTYTTYARNAIVGQYLIISQPGKGPTSAEQVSPSDNDDQDQSLNTIPSKGRPLFSSDKLTYGMPLNTLDQLNSKLRSRLKFDQIVSVNYVTRRGIYAPLTREGNIVVNSVVASCYAVIKDHDMAHMSMAPVRWLSHLQEWTIGTKPDTPTARRTTRHLKRMETTQRLSDYNNTQDLRSNQIDYSDSGKSIYSPQRVVHWYPKMLYRIGRYILPTGYIY